MSTGTIGRQTSSYRQGLVLGLTMAEIMLLLVFCLLIAVGVALSTERAKRDDALLRLQKVESAAALNEASLKNIRQNARLMELMDRAARLASQRQIDDFWRKLVESNDMVARMEQQGVPLASLEDEGPNAAKLRQLLNDGIDPDNVARNQALAAAIDAVLAEHKLDAMVTLTSGTAWLIDPVNGDSDSGGCSSPAAIAGYPHLTVPAGLFRGLPVGLSFFGAAFSEPKLIKLGSGFEAAGHARTPPRFLASVGRP